MPYIIVDSGAAADNRIVFMKLSRRKCLVHSPASLGRFTKHWSVFKALLADMDATRHSFRNVLSTAERPFASGFISLRST